MSFHSLVVMIVFLVLVWGGLAALLAIAIRKERDKRS